MRYLPLLFLLCACERPARTQMDGYYLSRTTERPDGTVITVTYQGPLPPVEALQFVVDVGP